MIQIFKIFIKFDIVSPSRFFELEPTRQQEQRYANKAKPL